MNEQKAYFEAFGAQLAKLNEMVTNPRTKNVSLEAIADFIVSECGVAESQRLVQLVNSRLEDEMRKKVGRKDCPQCEGTGVMHIANGQDDYYAERCICQPIEN